MEKKQRDSTTKSLNFLIKQLDATNDALTKVKSNLRENADKMISYIEQINSGKVQNPEPPRIENMQNSLNELNTVLQ